MVTERVNRMFHRLMKHYDEDRDKQFELMRLSDKDILKEYLKVFGTEEDRFYERAVESARYCAPSVTLY